jgi:hypothetical protein
VSRIKHIQTLRIGRVRFTVAVFLAFFFLLLFEFVLRIGGLPTIYWVIKKMPGPKRRLSAIEDVKGLCQALDVANRLYFRAPFCLQKSASAVCLLRIFGAYATLVIGVRKVPFRAHAWVELGGVPVYQQKAISEYLVLDRVAPAAA